MERDGVEVEGSGRLVLGPYGRHELHSNGERLLAFSGEHKLALLSTLFKTQTNKKTYLVL